MDGGSLFILLIQKSPTESGLIRQALTSNGVSKCQCVENLPTALARVGGGGVDVIILDLSLPSDETGGGLAGLRKMRHSAPHVPIVVLYNPENEGLALMAMSEGAADYLPKKGCIDGIGLAVRSAAEQERKQLNARTSAGLASRPEGRTIAFIGAKGGVGTTTIALNVACALARQRSVILVEMRSTFGSLQPYLRAYGQVRNTSHLLRGDALEIGLEEAGACLWPCKNVPGLSILFGPQAPEECGELKAARVKRLINALGSLADHVVLDLPSSLSDATRMAVESSGRLFLVMERDPVCVQLAKIMAQAIETWDGAPHPIDTILVNRASLGCPMPLSDIESQLGYPTLAVVPPGPDICVAAQMAHKPLVLFEPDGLIADSMIGLAEKCRSSLRTAPMGA